MIDIQKLKEIEKVIDKNKVKYNEDMKNHTTIKIGGKALCMVLPSNKDDIVNVIKFAKENSIEIFVIGNGSDLVVDDAGIEGVVIKLGKDFANYEVSGEYIYAQAGLSLPLLSQIAKKNSLAGLEFACGIPGTVGGAVRMNAGAYGYDISTVLEEITYLDENLNVKTMSKEKAHLGYRHSIFMDNKDLVVLSAKLKLEKGNIDEITSKMKENTTARNTKQPIDMPNAGSTFKRPTGYFVGKLIQDANLQGLTIGGMQVSKKHAGFIVNLGGATSRDVKDIIAYIQKVVYEKFNVKLEPEIEFIGGKNDEINT